MENGLIVYRDGEGIFTAGFYDNKLNSVSACRSQGTSYLQGSIWIGRVEKIIPGVHAAFVSVDKETENWYLPFDKMSKALVKQTHADGKLHVGDEIVVQIDREAGKNKPVSAVADFSLTGVNLVLMHGKKGIYFSSKIESDEFEKLWLSRLSAYKNGPYAIMFRTNSLQATEDAIYAELERLKQEYKRINDSYASRVVGTCLKAGLPAYLAELRDSYATTVDEYVTDDRDIFEQMKSFLDEYRPEQAHLLRWFDAEGVSLAATYDMRARLKTLTSKRVWLKSGAYLIIEHTEAMTVIDVNTGKATAGNKLGKEGFLSCNIEAAEEIAAQMRLRNISGIIIVDFIDMKRPEDRNALMDKLRECVAKDPIRTNVVDMTRLNLVEITRMKKKRPLYEELAALKEF